MKKRTVLAALCLIVGICLSACSSARSGIEVEGEVATDKLDEMTMMHGLPAKGLPDSTPEEETPETQTSDQPKKEKIKLTIGGIGSEKSNLKIVIYEFNKRSEDYTVGLIDYAYGNVSVEQAQTRMQTQMLAGDPPDMLLFEDYAEQVWAATGEDIHNPSPLPYISAGMLMDLDAFLENDPELSQEDFIIDDALHEYGGMYLLGSKFTLSVIYTLPQTAQKYSGWTLEDYIAIQNTLTDGQDMLYGVTPERFLELVGSRYIQQAIDMDAGTCDFDNPTFISLLETACHVNSYDTEAKHMQTDGSFKLAQSMVTEGSLMFASTRLCSAFGVAFDRYSAGGGRIWYGEGESPEAYLPTREGKRLAYIGAPTPDGSNGMLATILTPVGICAGTEHAEGCWEFIKFMVQHPIYQNLQDGTPLLESLLDENLETILSFTTQDASFITEQADMDIMIETARSCKRLSFYDEDVMDIIKEEAAGVFLGQITAEQAAARIQNRASVLVMERYG